ncbi:MAG TPA: hypothetical protein VN372_04830 [Methanospirillum sp.]|nr:hypothetical protein [Methanospirillum sp.]
MKSRRIEMIPFRTGFWVLILLLCSLVLHASAEDTNLFYPPLDPESFPAGASFTSVGSSSSFTSGPGTEDTSSQKLEVMTENRMSLMKGQTITHMVNFVNEGSVTFKSLSGTGHEIFSKNGGDWPENATFRSELGESKIVTGTTPITIETTPGTWYFTIAPIGEGGTYDLVASQMRGGATGTQPVASFSSSSGMSSISFG